MDPTTDPALRSWVPVAPESHFPIQNLPYGVFRRQRGISPHIGVAIGDYVLDLSVIEAAGLIEAPSLLGRDVFSQTTLKNFMSLGRAAWRDARTSISHLLRQDEALAARRPSSSPACPGSDGRCGNAPPRGNRRLHRLLLFARARHQRRRHDARPRQRAATELASPSRRLPRPRVVHRRQRHRRAPDPGGRRRPTTPSRPTFGPSRSLDFELEMGFFVGPGNTLGQPIPIEQTPEHIFGLVLVNDWSGSRHPALGVRPARPVPRQELRHDDLAMGRDARRPGAVPHHRPETEPDSLALSALPRRLGVRRPPRSPAANSDNEPPARPLPVEREIPVLERVPAARASHGQRLQPASGRSAGVGHDQRTNAGFLWGLLELAWKGTKPIALPNDEKRVFLQDDDRVTLTGWCQGPGYRVGFGEATGRVLSALGNMN